MLLERLGRSFVVGKNQDMDGGKARHEPFNCEPKKQGRYVKFCLALEGKASASEALNDAGDLDSGAREAELAEFGRVYRLFRQDNPDVDIQSALRIGQDTSVAPVLRRNVKNWQPDKILCKRWGVPEPKNTDDDELPGAKLQKKYAQQVQVGLAKATSPGLAPNFSMPPGLPPPGGMGMPNNESVGEPARPPKSLFTSIFGDADSDDD